ncbi:MAG TPA: sugar phosphate isomerase/epimerase family protein [Candidatus Saccharimonadales bacterium]|jgi:sugar phosphate isomerase/epimerase|nr:sugar phosphate isomerase/epimerase family protein [Candidatus Saccharimonadales bacterium]
METNNNFSRRSFLGFFAAAPLWAALAGTKHIPVGLELYSVRDDLKKDLMGTVRGVAKLGYECVEFFSPYYDWTLEYAKDVRKELDALGVHCYSTHNGPKSFTPEGIGKAIELNHALGTRYVVLAHPGEIKDVDGWKRVADTLNKANETLASQGLHAGYHNHDLEWKAVEGQKPMEILAANTDKSIMLQLDVGTCLEAGSDPVAWVEAHPGRIRSMHLKEWSPEMGYHVLVGDGVAPWKKLFAAAESKGGIEYYLIEQEGSDYSEMETAERCLAAYRTLHT